jgi:hypothetical protein
MTLLPSAWPQLAYKPVWLVVMIGKDTGWYSTLMGFHSLTFSRYVGLLAALLRRGAGLVIT